ncbi:MAG: SAP domain-containing protein, partial [Candidatus Thermoplasmatota archaeon]|nr:SAP domain-containing protein [Candidatus Thermoplasmatota archaeon]
MADETSSLTVAKLKALCVINDLATSGKKAELVERLLEAGLSPIEVGLSEAEAVEEAVQEEVVFSLEDETTISMEEDEPEPAEPVKEAVIEEEDDDVLEAVLVPDLVEDEPEEVFTPVATKRQDVATLGDMIKDPKVIAVVIVSLFLGAAGWWYINSSLEPFTAEPLRYGDTMEYTISGGLGDRPAIMASEGFLDLVFNFLEPDDDYCRIFMDYEGRGTLSVSQGTSQDLVGVSSQSLLGAVRSQGPYGSNDWLAVEIANTYEFDDFDIGRNTYSVINQGSCPEAEDGAYVPGEAVLTTKRHVELKEQVTLSTAFEFSATIDNKPYEGSAKTFDVGGLLGSLDVILPGVSLMLQPIELQDLFATEVIEEGASGERLGWRWRVVGQDTLGDDKAWKIAATHVDIERLCLGSATMEIWAEEDNPWASQQTVDVIISNDGSLQSSCSPFSEAFGDYLLPEGELELHHSFKTTKLTRGSKVLDLGKDYNIRPRANLLALDEDVQEDWGGQDKLHPPDASNMREHTLEKAMQCFDYIGGSASGAKAALDDGGYIWRGLDQRTGATTQWNVSWVALDDASGWVLFELTGEPTSDNCTYLNKGSFEELASHNRESIPAVANISTLEERLSDTQRYPQLTGSEAIFDTTGAYHDDARVGFLVAVPGDGANDLLGQLTSTTVGATTLDLSRTWEEGIWEHTFAVAVDATDGRVVGWTKLSQV